MRPTRSVQAVDLFAGAGGTSTGLVLACQALGRKVDLVAVNHWKEAIGTHAKNYPWAKHICASIESVDPRDAVPGGRVNILTAGPECTHHSRAAGGRPLNDQSRASAWHIMRWLELLRVDSLLIENVPEFRDWGPLDSKRRPVKRLKGTIYEAWVHAIRAFGYNVDTRILNAADYGAPTSRSRFFLLARRGNKPIAWPEPTHTKKGRGKKRWRAAREIIDWSLEGESIFTRKRPLKPRTLARIIEGLHRFGGPELQPFIVRMENGGGVDDLDAPLHTITGARGGSMALVKPEAFLLSQGSNGAPKSVNTDPVPALMSTAKPMLIEPFILSQGSGGAPRSVDDPVPTIPTDGAHALIVPFFGERDGQKPRAHSVDEPLPAATSHGAGGVAKAFIVEYHAGKNGNGDKRVSSIDDPLKTVDTGNRFALTRPFLLPVRGRFGKNTPKDIDWPLGTITSRGYGSLVEPFIVQFNGTENSQIKMSAKSVEEPLPTVAGSNHFGVANSFLTQYNGNSGVQSVEDPLPTIPTRDRFGLVQPEINGRRLEIKFRMLQPHELAGAMGFPTSYQFLGTKTDVVKQIGNAVAVDVAKALVKSLLSPISETGRFAA